MLDLFEKARAAKYSVTRNVIQSFGRSARATLLGSAKTSDTVKKGLDDFKAGEKWAKNFLKRNDLHSKVLHGEAGSVNHELIKKGMEGGGGAPPAYAQLSTHLVPLERSAEESGNRDAVFYLQKARMAMIAAHAARPVRQADIRSFT